MSGIGNRRGAPAKHGRTELHDNEKHDDGEHNRRKHLGQGHPHEHTPLGLQDLRSFRVLAWQDRTIYCVRRCLCPRAGLPTAGDAIALRTPIAP